MTLKIILAFVVHLGCACCFSANANFALGAEAPDPKPPRLPAAVEKVIGELKQLASSARITPIREALTGYSRIEKSGKISAEHRYRIHLALVETFKKNSHRALRKVAKRLFDGGAKSDVTSQVVMMKALSAEGFPASRKQRVKWLASLVNSKSDLVRRWAVRTLGSTRWPESVDALIDLIDREEAEGRAASVLWSNVRAELYRVLGGAASGATSIEIRRNWELLGKKVPEAPDYDADESGRGTRVASFFGDPVSPRSVFVLDRSSSMGATSSIKWRKDGKPPPPESRIEIVKKELQGVLRKLIEGFSFNVIAYDRALRVWREDQGKIVLHSVTAASIESADSFARKLVIGRGTNIHDSTVAALGVEGVYCIYLLSDGAPTVGGAPPVILRRLRHLNYLKGIRIVTYGFKADAGGAGADESFMQRIAAEHWGWYRRLNHVEEKKTETPQ